MNNKISIKYFQGKLDENTVYIFIDECGVLHNKNFKLIEQDIKAKGIVENANKSYTLTALVVTSKRQYSFLEKEMGEIKKEFFPEQDSKNLVLHRADLRSKNFLDQYNLSYENVYALENRVYSLIIKHKLKAFSVSCNKEVLYNHPKYKNQLHKLNMNIKEIILLKLLKKIQKNMFKKNPDQKMVLIIETKNEKDDKATVEFITNLIEEKILWIFKKVLMTKKTNKQGKTILGNELVDFICYSYFLWANNSLFHNSKFLLHNYPYHYKNSLSLIDNFFYNHDEDIIK